MLRANLDKGTTFDDSMGQVEVLMKEVSPVIWNRNAELGQVWRMFRIARAHNDQVPLLVLNRAVGRLVLFLQNGKCRRHPSDERDHDQLVFELALAYVILSTTPYGSVAASRLRSELDHELTRHMAESDVARAYQLVAPEEEVVSDSASDCGVAITVGDPTTPPEPPAIRLAFSAAAARPPSVAPPSPIEVVLQNKKIY